MPSSSDPYQPNPLGPLPKTIVQWVPSLSPFPTSVQSLMQSGLQSSLMVAAKAMEQRRAKAMKLLILAWTLKCGTLLLFKVGWELESPC